MLSQDLARPLQISGRMGLVEIGALQVRLREMWPIMIDRRENMNNATFTNAL